MHNKLTKELHRFNQRKLRKGELVLLAFTIANSLPLLPEGSPDAKGFVLGHGVLIERVIYRLNEFAHIDQDARRELMDTIARFAMWRSSVAYGFRPFFTGNQDMVVDNLSGLTRYIDMSTMCPIGDELDNVSWLTSVFYDLVKSETELFEASKVVIKEEA